jgi:putative addiction module component (TIGR02574 family)
MDITATLNEIATLSVEDRIRLVQAIWDSIAAEQVYPDLTDAQKQELDRRTADYNSNPDNVLTWEEIKASILSTVSSNWVSRYSLTASLTIDSGDCPR